MSYPQNPSPQQPQYGAPQPQPQPQYGAPQAEYGAPQQQYGAPQQPQFGAPQQQYGQPGAPVPPPGMSVPPAPVKKKGGKARLIVSLVIIVVLIVLGVIGWAASRNDATNAKVGDCLVGQDKDTLKKVDCAKTHEWTVIGEVKGKTQSEFGDDVCSAYPTTDAAYWWGKAGEKGNVLCLQKVSP